MDNDEAMAMEIRENESRRRPLKIKTAKASG